MSYVWIKIQNLEERGKGKKKQTVLRLVREWDQAIGGAAADFKKLTTLLDLQVHELALQMKTDSKKTVRYDYFISRVMCDGSGKADIRNADDWQAHFLLMSYSVPLQRGNSYVQVKLVLKKRPLVCDRNSRRPTKQVSTSKVEDVTPLTEEEPNKKRHFARMKGLKHGDVKLSAVQEDELRSAQERATLSCLRLIQQECSPVGYSRHSPEPTSSMEDPWGKYLQHGWLYDKKTTLWVWVLGDTTFHAPNGDLQSQHEPHVSLAKFVEDYKRSPQPFVCVVNHGTAICLDCGRAHTLSANLNVSNFTATRGHFRSCGLRKIVREYKKAQALAIQLADPAFLACQEAVAKLKAAVQHTTDVKQSTLQHIQAQEYADELEDLTEAELELQRLKQLGQDTQYSSALADEERARSILTSARSTYTAQQLKKRESDSNATSGSDRSNSNSDSDSDCSSSDSGSDCYMQGEEHLADDDYTVDDSECSTMIDDGTDRDSSDDQSDTSRHSYHSQSDSCPEQGFDDDYDDSVVGLFAKLIARGVLPETCFFMIYVKAVLNWLDFSTQPVRAEGATFPAWPQEVYDVGMSLNQIGGKAAYNFVRGPGAIGEGRNGTTNMFDYLLPLPDYSKLVVRLPEWSLEPGLYTCLLKSAHAVAADPARGVASWCEGEQLEVIFVSISFDGMAIKPEVAFDSSKQQFGGAQGGPKTIDEFLAHDDMDALIAALGTRLYTEAGVIMMSAVDNKVSFALGTDAELQKGTGEEVEEHVRNVIRTAQTCDCCLESKNLPEHELVMTDPNFCKSTCGTGECPRLAAEFLKLYTGNIDINALPDPCSACADHGHKSALQQLRRCDICIENKTKCRRFCCLAFSLDCASKNKTAMVNWETRQRQGTLHWDVALVAPLPDYLHVLKSLFMSMLNWCLMAGGYWFFLELLWVLYDDPYIGPMMMIAGVTLNAVKCKDRMGTVEIPQRSQLWKMIKTKVSWITCTFVPSVRRFWKSNLTGDTDHVLDVCKFSRQYFYFLGRTKDKVNLKRVRMHSPGDVTTVGGHLKDPSALDSAHGILFIADQDGISYIDVEGNVLLNPATMTVTQLNQALKKLNIFGSGLEGEGLVQRGKRWKLHCHLNGNECKITPDMMSDKQLKLELLKLDLDQTGNVDERRERLSKHMNMTQADRDHVNTQLDAYGATVQNIEFKSAQTEVKMENISALTIKLREDEKVICFDAVFLKQTDEVNEEDTVTKVTEVVKCVIRVVASSLVGEVLQITRLPVFDGCDWVDLAINKNQVLLCCKNETNVACDHCGIYEVKAQAEKVTFAEYCTDNTTDKPCTNKFCRFRHVAQTVNPCGIAISDSGNFFVTTSTPDFTGVLKLQEHGNLLTHIAGSAQRGSLDGSQHSATFSRPGRLSVEGASNLIVTDVQGVRVVVFSEGLWKFLKVVDGVAKAYSLPIRSRGKKSSTRADPVVVHAKLQALQEYLVGMRTEAQNNLGLTGATNGPQGTTSNDVLSSIGLLVRGLKWIIFIATFLHIGEEIDCRALGTQHNEHFHCMMRVKEAMPTWIGFCRQFVKVVTERVKRLAAGALPYFTKRRYHYVPPAQSKMYNNIRPQFPRRKSKAPSKKQRQKVPELTRQQKMRLSTFKHRMKGQRQATVRSRTTKMKCGTLPQAIYISRFIIQNRQRIQANMIAGITMVLFACEYILNAVLTARSSNYVLGRIVDINQHDCNVMVQIFQAVENRFEATCARTIVPLNALRVIEPEYVSHPSEDSCTIAESISQEMESTVYDGDDETSHFEDSSDDADCEFPTEERKQIGTGIKRRNATLRQQEKKQKTSTKKQKTSPGQKKKQTQQKKKRKSAQQKTTAEDNSRKPRKTRIGRVVRPRQIYSGDIL